MTKTMPVPLTVGRAACAEPQHLPLVDAAADKPGGPAGQEMAKTLCAACPVIEACFVWAMRHAETGVWAGMSPKKRTVHGAPNRPPIIPASARKPQERPRDTPPRAPQQQKPSVTVLRLVELGVNEGEVRRWAYEQGLTTTTVGRASLALVEAYAAARAAA